MLTVFFPTAMIEADCEDWLKERGIVASYRHGLTLEASDYPNREHFTQRWVFIEDQKPQWLTGIVESLRP